jgi:anthranilate synthase/phosphoribosyltransferase
VPILGVCLGHQALAEVYGGKVVRAQRLMHGKTSPILHKGRGLFAGIDNPFEATRYHSLIVERESVPHELELMAWTPDGEIMALKHVKHETWGVQFHPESVLTKPGIQLIENFLVLCRQKAARDDPDLARQPDRPNDLTRDQARAAMEQILSGQATPSQIAGFAVALRMKGERPDEIAGMAEAMRQRVAPIRTRRNPLLDTCGTGGDNAGTFNISTTVAIVTASSGVAVAKHGNRAVSSRTGSADVLESLGVRIDLTPESAARSLDVLGITFLFAPNYHAALRHASAPRHELGVRTVFNVLGPLTNPAGAKRQLLGVYADSLVLPVAEVLQRLGSERAWVVHGRDGLDELSVFAKTHVAALVDGQITEFEVDPARYGLAHDDRDGVKGGGAAENASRASARCSRASRAPRATWCCSTPPRRSS